MSAGDECDLLFTDHFGSGSCSEKCGVHANIEDDHDCCAEDERERNIPARITNFAGNIGGSVPTGVSVHYPVETDRERGARDQRGIAFDRQK